MCDAGRRPFAWGRADCFLFVAGWAFAVTGVDPAARYRGTYGDVRAARRLIRENGGAVRFAERVLADAGYSRIRVPALGDVGLVRVAGLWRRCDQVTFGPVGAICVRHNLWAIKSSEGITLGNFPVIKAWALHA